jgi:hypothetical protein
MKGQLQLADQQQQASALEDMVLTLLDSQAVEEEQVLLTVASLAGGFYPDLGPSDFLAIAARLLERLAVRLELGVAVTAADHVLWLQERKSEIAWTRWGAYRKLLLRQGRQLKVLDKLGEATDAILDLTGDPQATGSWQRRGLVIGEVQSGKTSTYIGLLDKAADAGFRLFIIIGGHTESLRRQTQARIDEGFVGRDSAYMSKELRHLVDQKLVGVGTVDPDIRAYGFTTITSDFSVRSAQSLNFEISETMSEPVILVVKKNTQILKNLRQWLEDQAPPGGHRMPVLLLDDEADYASINTNDEADPTAVNQALRDLLALSQRSSYVGFTATPFANVLIDDDDKEDLFPRDFIYTLESPSNYVGADAVFGDSDLPSPLRDLDDAEAVIPLKHRSALNVVRLPESLVDAIAAFIVANAIRDLRGQELEPRSMLINVSRFNHVQQEVFGLVDDQLAAFRNAIEFENHDHEESKTYARLREVFEREYVQLGLNWASVRESLVDSVDSMQAVLVNSRTNSAEAYASIAAAGRTRIIAVGGAVLSRGLTLNGLMISYFYQKSRASDTLMQMGRWFGYRDGYRDLCRLWIDEEVAGWYSFIAESSRELRDDLREMRRLGLTPKDFGLKVRKHPEALLVTASNKSRSADTVQRVISLRDKTLESARIVDDAQRNVSNYEAGLDLVASALSEGSDTVYRVTSVVISEVPKTIIADFLTKFGSAPSDLFFAGPTSSGGTSTFAEYVRSALDSDLRTWDLVVVGGSSAAVESIGAGGVRRPRRTVKVGADGLFVSGNSRRVAGSADLGLLLTKEKQSAVRVAAEGKTVAERNYRAHLERPAILLYFIEPDWIGESALKNQNSLNGSDVPLLAVKVAFPADPEGIAHDARAASGATYLINTVLQRDWLQGLALDLEDDDRRDLDE